MNTAPVSEYCTNRNIVAGDAAFKVRILNLVVARTPSRTPGIVKGKKSLRINWFGLNEGHNDEEY